MRESMCSIEIIGLLVKILGEKTSQCLKQYSKRVFRLNFTYVHHKKFGLIVMCIQIKES